MTQNHDIRSPRPDELEMTVFGPGVGECIVLHLGEGDWIIIDSCTSPVGDEPAALGYLRSIGVDPDASVRTIVATHWHDDRIVRGATKTRRAVNPKSGHVCLRIDLSKSPASPAIELFGSATRL